jgi:hypothetical protein
VARYLQTAPVIPPGAFPNGQGTGEQYGSEIPGWYTSLSQTESANTLAAWTAKQKALEEEARRKAEEESRYNAPSAGGEESEETEPLGGYEGWACEYAAETGQEDPECQGGGEPVAVASAPCSHEENPKANHCNSRGYGEVLVTFDGQTSTAAQILSRAKAEYKKDNKYAVAIEKGLSEIMKGFKETSVPFEQIVNGTRVVIYEVMMFAGDL